MRVYVGGAGGRTNRTNPAHPTARTAMCQPASSQGQVPPPDRVIGDCRAPVSDLIGDPVGDFGVIVSRFCRVSFCDSGGTQLRVHVGEIVESISSQGVRVNVGLEIRRHIF